MSCDDIDDLLDDAEKLLAEEKDTGLKDIKTGKRQEGLVSTDDLDTLLEEIDIATEAPVVVNKDRNKLNPLETKTKEPGQKCRVTKLGGSSHKMGRNTTASQLVCDKLRCVACDFQVCWFDDAEWDESCDYMFFRNGCTDPIKLKTKINHSPGRRAYACQCKWASAHGIGNLTEFGNVANKWTCGRHES
eukprot:m.227426 g.227426  ORF g.227426 m.227426 type:complete len:189 (+) comp15973_c0_seq1:357-923(+)